MVLQKRNFYIDNIVTWMFYLTQIQIMREIGDRKSTSGYCTYVGGNLVTWRSKKQNVISRFSAEAEYRAMTQAASEMIWIQSFLTTLGFHVPTPMKMFCDNQAAIFIANNPTFQERTKHVEIDCHFIRDMVLKGIISTPFTRSPDQLADIFTKGLSVGSHATLCNKLGMYDMYSPARGGVLEYSPTLAIILY